MAFCWENPDSHSATYIERNFYTLKTNHDDPSFVYYEALLVCNNSVYLALRIKDPHFAVIHDGEEIELFNAVLTLYDDYAGDRFFLFTYRATGKRIPIR